ncbi:MAG: hypothetical protein M2R45_03966 [Verrucomicrobia subdivision 3 bacterium]|nr:hypothetical protein [Limisphaerales bacterium]MCS1415514.1 hypothetical protein [Limisphaerales bacterium]
MLSGVSDALITNELDLDGDIPRDQASGDVLEQSFEGFLTHTNGSGIAHMVSIG